MEIFKESEDYVIYAPQSLGYVINKEINILENNIKKYYDLFGVEKFRKLVINYFDKKDDFREFIYSLRGERESLPSYATGTFDNDMVNAFIPPNLVIGSSWYIKALYMSSHEFFHIMYRELVWKDDYSNRIVWYDEGMAQFMCGEKYYLDDEEKFYDFVIKVKENTKIMPNMNELVHGETFVNDNFDGYDLSYLCVRYLYETMGYQEFKSLVYNLDKVRCIGESILNDALDYYEEKLSSLKK